jgi:hypothetical protein
MVLLGEALRDVPIAVWLTGLSASVDSRFGAGERVREAVFWTMMENVGDGYSEQMRNKLDGK